MCVFLPFYSSILGAFIVGFFFVVFKIMDDLNGEKKIAPHTQRQSLLPQTQNLRQMPHFYTEQSKDIAFTHAHVYVHTLNHTHANGAKKKRGYCSFFFFLLSLKRAIKYIKTYLQSFLFGQKKQKQKRCNKLQSCFAGVR